MPLPEIKVPELNLYESKLAADEQKYKNALLKAQYDKLQKGNDPDEIERTAKVVNMARGASTKEEADAIIQRFAPDLQGVINVFPGKEVTIRTDDGTEITVPPEMQDMFDDQQANPQKWADPIFAERSLKWGIQSGGISVKPPQNSGTIEKTIGPYDFNKTWNASGLGDNIRSQLEKASNMPNFDPRKQKIIEDLRNSVSWSGLQVVVFSDGGVVLSKDPNVIGGGIYSPGANIEFDKSDPLYAEAIKRNPQLFSGDESVLPSQAKAQPQASQDMVSPYSARGGMTIEKLYDPKTWEDPELRNQAIKFAIKNKINIKRPEQKQYAPSETERLVDLVNSLPEGDPRKTFYTARLKKLTESKQQRITVGPDGSVSIVEGPAGADPGITKKTQGETEGKIIDGSEQYALLMEILNEFKPEYQEIGNRLSKSFTAIRAKLGQGVSKEDAQGLTEFKKYQRKAIENINNYIKDVTGAAMSEAEARRLRLAQPDPGENWWDGDDPITFKAKLVDTIRATMAAVARHNYYRAKGLSAQSIRELINSGQVISLDSLHKKMK